MGVHTTADEKIDSAIEHIDDAIKLILEVVGGDFWGCDSFDKIKLMKMAIALQETRDM